jgi:hypothetical protein
MSSAAREIRADLLLMDRVQHYRGGIPHPSKVANMTQKDFRELALRVLVPVLVGGLYYLIAHYWFSYSDAARNGVLITVVAGGGLILQYIFKRFRGR